MMPQSHQRARAAINGVAVPLPEQTLFNETLTADAEFAAAVARRVATWDPATGRLTERNRGGWFSRRSR